MKLPNGYGTVYKLTGKRRKPWVAKKLIGKTLDMENRKVHRQYLTVGYYEKRSDALSALSSYNADPYDTSVRFLTLQEAYERWSAEYFPKLKSSRHYEAAWKVLEPLQTQAIADLKLDNYQHLFITSGKNAPTLRNVKSLLDLVYDYAVVHEIVPKSKRDMLDYLEVGKENPKKLTRTIFSRNEIDALCMDDTDLANTTLVLIFTGLRVSELFENAIVDYDRQLITLTEAKTAAGIREVPIADKLVSRVHRFMDGHDSIKSYRAKLKKEYDHLPHDTRHTFTTLLAENGVDQRLIDSIIGHVTGNLSLDVYTHFTLEKKLDVVNTICETFVRL